MEEASSARRHPPGGGRGHAGGQGGVGFCSNLLGRNVTRIVEHAHKSWNRFIIGSAGTRAAKAKERPPPATTARHHDAPALPDRPFSERGCLGCSTIKMAQRFRCTKTVKPGNLKEPNAAAAATTAVAAAGWNGAAAAAGCNAAAVIQGERARAWVGPRLP